MFTRKDYMNKKVSHDEYYGQFAVKEVQNIVSWYIGLDRIKVSTDPNFNDISLEKWDALAPAIRQVVGRKIAEANGTEGISLSDCVCTAKAAARILKEM